MRQLLKRYTHFFSAMVLKKVEDGGKIRSKYSGEDAPANPTLHKIRVVFNAS